MKSKSSVNEQCENRLQIHEGPVLALDPPHMHAHSMLYLVSLDSHRFLEGFYLTGVLDRWPHGVLADSAPEITGFPSGAMWGANKTLGNLVALPLEGLGHFLPLLSFLPAYVQDTRIS